MFYTGFFKIESLSLNLKMEMRKNAQYVMFGLTSLNCKYDFI